MHIGFRQVSHECVLDWILHFGLVKTSNSDVCITQFLQLSETDKPSAMPAFCMD